MSEPIRRAKDKTVHRLSDDSLLLEFNDIVPRLAHATAMTSGYFHVLLESCDIPTNFISTTPNAGEIQVRKAILIGETSAIFTRHFRATSDLVRRHPDLFRAGEEIKLTEVARKDNISTDQPIDPAILIASYRIGKADAETIYGLVEDAAAVIAGDLRDLGLTLWNIGLEVGLVSGEGSNPTWAIIDQIGPENMCVYAGDRRLHPLEFTAHILSFLPGE